jgi:hypothetical protein
MLEEAYDHTESLVKVESRGSCCEAFAKTSVKKLLQYVALR